MTKIYQQLPLRLLLCTALTLGVTNVLHAVTVVAFTTNTTSVSRLDLFEATFTLNKTWTNPYNNTSQVEVDAYITAPGSSTAVMVPGFWYKGYSRSLSDTTELLTATGDSSWKIRYSPRLTGTYTYYIQIIDR